MRSRSGQSYVNEKEWHRVAVRAQVESRGFFEQFIATTPVRFSVRKIAERSSLKTSVHGKRGPLGARAVERLSAKLVVSTYSRVPTEFSACIASSSRALKASVASSVCDIRTVVKGGIVNCARRMSSNPITDNSCGTAMPHSYAWTTTPIAIMSFERKMAVGCVESELSLLNAVIPDSTE